MTINGWFHISYKVQVQRLILKLQWWNVMLRPINKAPVGNYFCFPVQQFGYVPSEHNETFYKIQFPAGLNMNYTCIYIYQFQGFSLLEFLPLSASLSFHLSLYWSLLTPAGTQICPLSNKSKWDEVKRAGVLRRDPMDDHIQWVTLLVLITEEARAFNVLVQRGWPYVFCAEKKKTKIPNSFLLQISDSEGMILIQVIVKQRGNPYIFSQERCSKLYTVTIKSLSKKSYMTLYWCHVRMKGAALFVYCCGRIKTETGA